MNTEAGDDFHSVKSSTSDDAVSPVQRKDTFREYHEKKLAKNYSLSYPTPIFHLDAQKRAIYLEVVGEIKLEYDAILGFGFDNFTSYASYFCKYEVRNGAEIVSVGSGSDAVEREIIASYRQHFADEIKITLVDPKPDYEVDFKTVDGLIEKRPNVVGNCIVFIIWPDPMSRNGGYDIEALQKLQPFAALILYDPTEVSGSYELTRFLCRETNEWDFGYHNEKDETFKLANYKVEEVVRQNVYIEAGKKTEVFGFQMMTEPASAVHRLRMVKLKRTH